MPPVKRVAAIALLLLAVVAAACGKFKTIATNGSEDGGAVDANDASNADSGDDGATSTTLAVVQQIPGAGALDAIWGSGPTDIHAVGDNGMIYDYDGNAWAALGGAETGATLTGLWGSGPNDVYAVGTLAADGRGIVFHNDGSGWTQETSTATGLLSVWGISGTVWAVGTGGEVYQKMGAGDFVSQVHLPPNPYVDGGTGAPVLWSISGNAANDIVVAADLDSTFLFDQAMDWTYSYDPVDRTRNYRSAWGAPSQTLNVFLGANYYGIWWWLEDEDGGTDSLLLLNEERDTAEKASDYIWGIWGAASDRVVFVGDHGRIMWFDGGENGPTVVPSPVQGSLFGVWGTSLDDIWVVGDDATILHGSIPH
jgi:hypothetical protein